MIRRIFGLILCAFLTACTPRLIPLPITPGPTIGPETPTAWPIDGPVITSPALTHIAMMDERNGWGISETAVLRTNDGGQTWFDVGPKDAQQLGYAATPDFLDRLNAWVLVADPADMLKGTLYHTSDAGVNWQSVSVPFGGGDMQFLDEKNGWMMASLGAGAGSMGVAVYRTSDAGSTWTQAYTNDPNQPNAGDSLPLGGMKDGLAAISMQTAWIAGVIYTPGTIYLFRSDDAGATWHQVPIQVPKGYEQAELNALAPRFVSGSAAYLPVTVASQNGVMLTIYVSHDGGNTWVATPTMIPQGGQPDFVSATDGFVWNGTDFYVTHDGAQTWKVVTPDVKFTDSFAGMDFIDPATGWVITNDASGAHALYRTLDGGVTWNLIGQ
jgi:photosystem II stability/assembly factor-like uncharacterized protein